MVTPELTAGGTFHARVRASAACTALLFAVTAGASVVGAVAPALVSTVAPHPTLEPTLSAWASILLNNARVLALPILLAAFGYAHGRWARPVADTAVGVVLAGNAVLVGLTLGRWRTELIPYLPQLPLEWLAAGTAAATWLCARNRQDQHQETGALVIQTIAVIALLMAASALEVFATPHAPRTSR